MPNLSESKMVDPSPLENAFGGMNLNSGNVPQPLAPVTDLFS